MMLQFQVVDMPAVVEIISILEKITITKELLETTRLGKYVNQLRRNTSNKLLAKRAKDLVKKWRDTVLPDSNGQIKHTDEKKRPAKDSIEAGNAKRPRINGQLELDFSDNSNSSFKETKSIVVINSDSNSSLPDPKHEPPLEQQQPKKRGRKKGSKNHKNLIEEAETSFSNKLSVSRGNAKVKTTQELLADLHIKNCMGKPVEDLNEKAAKLSERVSIIDQKLNATNRFRNFQKKGVKSEVIESGIVTNITRSSDDEIIVVDDEPIKVEMQEPVKVEIEEKEEVTVAKSLSIEEALALLPPVDISVLEEKDLEPYCTCQLIENNTDFSVEDDEEVNLQHTFEFIEDKECLARNYLSQKYNLGLDSEILNKQVKRLHIEWIPNVNGNFGVGKCKEDTKKTDDGLYVNVVPNVNTENLLKFSNIDYTQPASENFKKYSISEVTDDAEGVAKNSDSDSTTFREWHEMLETPSYNGEIFKILPYVIID
ncbi:hypothetical protein FQA39_LY14281 [Lamprigera yunnana]|nr:hypothetical protein FQA39_LY14281 [Lamprigera yunnana]